MNETEAGMHDEADPFFSDVDCAMRNAAEVVAEPVAEVVAVDAPAVVTSVPLVATPVEANILPKKLPKRSTPNYKSEEVVATVWAYIAMSEEEQIQTTAMQLSRLERMYLPKAKELHRLGRWASTAARTPEQSAELRSKNPASLHARAKKAIEVIVNVIGPIWVAVKREQQSGWGKEDFIRETKQR